jgi:hypothetical protein
LSPAVHFPARPVDNLRALNAYRIYGHVPQKAIKYHVNAPRGKGMKIKCPHCEMELEINPAALLGSSKKTMTPAAIKARQEAAKRPRPGRLTSIKHKRV